MAKCRCSLESPAAFLAAERSPPGSAERIQTKDRVLISYTRSWFDETATHRNAGGSRLKVLPIRWFHGGREPYGNPMLEKLEEP